MFFYDVPFMHNGYFRQYLATYIASLTLVICGTGIAWPSPVLPQFKTNDTLNSSLPHNATVTHHPFEASETELSWMVAVLYFGNIVSPVPTGYIMDRFGRKTSLLVLNLIPFISWLLIWFIKNAIAVYVARVLQGLWLGISYTIIPIYLGEIAEPAIRGSISTNFQTLIYVGVLIEYVVGPYVSYEVLAIVSFIFPLIFFVLFPWMPESPYYCIMRGDLKGAERALTWLRDKDANIDEEIGRINSYILQQKQKKMTVKEIFTDKPTVKAFIIVSVLSIFQRFSGIGTMMAYGSTTLPDNAVGPLQANECMMVVCVVWIVFGFGSQFLADKFTRKTLLVVSSIGACVSMLLAAVWYNYHYDGMKAKEADIPLAWAPFACFVVYGASYSIGMGPIVTTIKGEIFPSHIKGLASGITTIILAVSSFIVNKIYQPLEDGPGIYVNYIIYCVISFVNIIFTLTFVIETKGKSLQDIQTKLNRQKKGKQQVATIQDTYRDIENQ